MAYSQKTQDQEEIKRITENILHRKRNFFFTRSLKLMVWDLTIKGALFIKRTLDIVASICLLLFLSPLLLVVCILIKLDSEGPIIYQSVRIGQYGKPFKFLKFRSMYVNSAELLEIIQKNQEKQHLENKKNGIHIPKAAKSDMNKPKSNDLRLTRIGRFIRKASIDELPQLVNVLIGDMSLVGPRPPIPEEVADYTLNQRKRLNIKPGITCIWQVTGRSDIPFEQQVELDKQYISNHSIIKDLWILMQTIPAVITGKGAY